MRKHFTVGIASALSYTWIHTSSSNAGFVNSTLAVYSTFRSTIRWSANKLWLTTAYSLRVNFATLTVWSARWRSTRRWLGNIWKHNYCLQIRQEWRIINTKIYYSKLLGLNCTYLQPFQHNTCTHCLLNLVDNNMKVYGLPLDKWHLTHTRQGKGLCIYFEHRLALANNLSWWRIQVDILRRDCQ